MRPSLWFGCGQRLRCVIGRRSGACPTREEAAAFAHALPAGIPAASYTQWEYFLALHHGKECLLFLAQDAYEPDEATSHGDDFPDLQREFVERIKCSVPSPPPDMQRVQARADLIASLHRSDVRSALQAGQHRSYQVPIRGGPGNAKPPRGSTQRSRRSRSRPCPTAEPSNGRASLRRRAEHLLGTSGQVGAQRLPVGEAAIAAGSEILHSDLRGLAERDEARLVLGLPLLDQPQSVAQHLAGILVAAACTRRSIIAA